MREKIVEVLNETLGQEVKIYTDHKLFGKQQIEMEFEPETELGVGFRCREQAIYIDENDIVGYAINDNEIIIDGVLMSIHIVKLNK